MSQPHSKPYNSINPWTELLAKVYAKTRQYSTDNGDHDRGVYSEYYIVQFAPHNRYSPSGLRQPRARYVRYTRSADIAHPIFTPSIRPGRRSKHILAVHHYRRKYVKFIDFFRPERASSLSVRTF